MKNATSRSFFRRCIRLLSVLAFCILLFRLSAQSPIGSPFIHNYPPAEYQAHNQNWSIAQDERGIMYFCNNSGVLEYDGVNWVTITEGIASTIRSMSIDEGGRIYIGTYADFGYLEPDSLKRLHFVSLKTKVDTQYHDFADVWHTHVTNAGVFFVSRKFLFRWDGHEMHVWQPSTFFHSGHAVRGRMFVMVPRTGILEVIGDSLSLIPNGDVYKMTAIRAMLPYGKNRILIAPLEKEFAIYDGKSLTTFPTQADDIIHKGQLYCGTYMQNGMYAFGTLQDGAVVIDSLGKLLFHLNKASGLQDETVYHLKSDREGGLWMAMHIGISRVQVASPFTQFTDREGLEGSALEIERADGKLFAVTSMGVYELDESPGSKKTPARFRRIEGVSPQGWALTPFGDGLLAATFQGVWLIENNHVTLVDSAYAVSLHRSKQDPNRIFVGIQNGIESIYYQNGRWKEEGLIEGVSSEILSIYERIPGTIWITSRYKGVYRLEFPEGYTSTPKVTLFDTTSGLPDVSHIAVYSCSRGDCFSPEKGVYFFDNKTQRFLSDSTLFKGVMFDQLKVFSVTENRHGDLWIISDKTSGFAKLAHDHTYHWSDTLFKPVATTDLYYAYPDPLDLNITWFGGIDRIFRYDASIDENNRPEFKTLIRSVYTNGDSLLYGGAGEGPAEIFYLTRKSKSLRFHFAAPTFDDASRTEFQYKLEGYDANWSEWSKETYKDYTGLQKGNYRFLVRSRNMYGQMGSTASVDFHLQPPFYLSWFAYVFYVLLLMAVIYMLWKYDLSRIRKQHSHQIKELELEKLKELDQMKSRFFADISHEFRTPLTLILGPVENILSTKPDNEYSGQFQMIRRNAQRLLRLINQLLDLSKLEAGKMKLELNHENIIPVIRGMVNSFESLVKSKNIDLSVSENLTSAYLDFDRDKIEQVLSNLISNAVKFTPYGGKIKVDIKQNDKAEGLEIKVADTGPGISADQLPFVFDRYYQGKEAAKSGEPGTGIGLALAKEFVELHQGTLTVESIEGIGATFVLKLPLARHPDQILESGPRTARVNMPVDEAIQSVVSLLTEQDLASENTMLLVEDNIDMRAFIRESLAGYYKVIESTDGKDGLEKAFEIIPDIIISDVMMPHKDGLEFCEELKRDERTSHIPIILLTARADIESRLAGLERGADDYLAKPFNREELLVRSKNLLDQRQRLRARYASLQKQGPAEETEVKIEDAFIQKVRSIVEENLSDSYLEIDQLSKLVGMSRSQLFRKIKALTGQSPSLFIRSIRLHRAKELLLNSQKNVSEVAYEVGFSSPAYFSDAFVEAFGIRPSQVKIGG